MKRLAQRAARVAAVAVAATLALSACASGGASSDSSSGETKVTMATQPWLGYGPWYIADEKGYFADEGVDVTLTNFMTDADMTAAFAAGRVQFANAASHSALKFMEQGLDVTIVLMLDASLTADAILADSSIDTVADLKGTSIAFEEGSVSNLLLGYALEQNGLSLDDITPVPMGPSEAATALIGGSVPSAVTYEPYISEAEANSDDFHTLYTAAEKEGLISDVLVVDNKFLKENPEAVQSVVNAWGPAIDFYKSDTDEARKIIATNVGSDVDALSSAFDGVKFFSLADNKTELGGNYLESTLPAVQDIASKIGVIEGGTDLPKVVDLTFVTDAE
jgi:NitT/TauT family transport system substrate-binding protein